MREPEGSQRNQKDNARYEWESLAGIREDSAEGTTWDDLTEEVPFAGEHEE